MSRRNFRFWGETTVIPLTETEHERAIKSADYDSFGKYSWAKLSANFRGVVVKLSNKHSKSFETVDEVEQ